MHAMVGMLSQALGGHQKPAARRGQALLSQAGGALALIWLQDHGTHLMPLPLLDESGPLLGSRVTDFSAHFTRTNRVFSSLQWAAWAEQLLAQIEQERVSLLSDCK